MRKKPTPTPMPIELRPLTAAERAVADEINPRLGVAYGAWLDDGWTPDEVEVWLPLTLWNTRLPTRANQLRSVGWGAEQVRAVLAGADVLDAAGEIQLVGADRYVGRAQQAIQAPSAEALVVIAHFLHDWAQSLAWQAGDLRHEAAVALNKSGWDQSRIAALLGLTKQRVSVILRRQPQRPDWDDPPVVVAPRGTVG